MSETQAAATVAEAPFQAESQVLRFLILIEL